MTCRSDSGSHPDNLNWLFLNFTVDNRLLSSTLRTMTSTARAMKNRSSLKKATFLWPIKPIQHLAPIILTFGALLISIQSFCQWTPIPGPSSTFNVSAFFTYRDIMYISTTNGLYSSTKMNEPWTFESHTIINNFALKGDSLLYRGPGSAMEVLYLPDIHRKVEPACSAYFHSVVPCNGNIYMAHEYGGFYRVTPEKDFIMLNDGLPVERIYFSHDWWEDGHPLVSMVRCGPWFIGITWQGLYRTPVSTISWSSTCSACNLDFRNSKLYSFDDELYVVSGNHLYKSLDFGQTLIGLGSQFPGSTVKINTLYKSDSILYVGFGGAGIYYLQGDDPVWHDLNGGLVGKNINLIQRIDSTLICGSTTSGFNYMKPGSSWTKNNTGLYDSYSFFGIATNRNYLFAWDAKHLYRTNSMGNSWKNISPSLGSNTLSGPVDMNDTLLLIANPTLAGTKSKLFYSTSDGLEWIDFTPQLPEVLTNYEFGMSYVGGKLFIRADFIRVVFYTTDFGKSWINVSFPSDYCNSISSLVYYRNSVFAAFCGYKQIARLVNDSWVDTGDGLPDNSSPQGLFLCNDVLHCQMENGSWYRYNDDNRFWSRETLAINDSDYSFYSQIGGENYFASSYLGWLITNDCLQTVRPLDFSGLLSTDGVYYLKCLDNQLFITQGTNGIWTRKIQGTSSVISDRVHQNVTIYPNPAGDHFTVSGFTEGEQVYLGIYNSSGMKCLQSKVRNGEFINVESMQNGIYFIEMFTQNQRVTKKLVVWK